MLDIDPEDRAAFSARRKSSNRIVLIAAAVMTVLAIGAIAAFWGKLNGEDRFTDVYAALQTAPLPVRLQNQPEILPLLQRLQVEHCDDKAASSLGDALIAENEKRLAARILAAFSTECPRFNWLMYKAADYYFGLSDFAEARKISDRLVSQWPEIAQFHFLAAQIDEGLGLHTDALAEFQASIERTPDHHTLTEPVFTGLAKAHAQLGQFCAAATAIRQWVSLDPAQRDNSPSRKLIADYLAQGPCPATAR